MTDLSHVPIPPCTPACAHRGSRQTWRRLLRPSRLPLRPPSSPLDPSEIPCVTACSATSPSPVSPRVSCLCRTAAGPPPCAGATPFASVLYFLKTFVTPSRCFRRRRGGIQGVHQPPPVPGKVGPGSARPRVSLACCLACPCRQHPETDTCRFITNDLPQLQLCRGGSLRSGRHGRQGAAGVCPRAGSSTGASFDAFCLPATSGRLSCLSCSGRRRHVPARRPASLAVLCTCCQHQRAAQPPSCRASGGCRAGHSALVGAEGGRVPITLVNGTLQLAIHMLCWAPSVILGGAASLCLACCAAHMVSAPTSRACPYLHPRQARCRLPGHPRRARQPHGVGRAPAGDAPRRRRPPAPARGRAAAPCGWSCDDSTGGAPHRRGRYTVDGCPPEAAPA